ncbi:MAG: outer membrane protein assembly factor [Marinilabiliales bacterium]|nr:outer membrane protein assembly factor [Marinilabiliales bacterium]
MITISAIISCEVKIIPLPLRTAFGIAIPYGNSIDIPFEKGFYGGGSNGMRAWPLRYLGPGAYQNLNPGD